MNENIVIDIMREAIYIILKTSAPMLIVSLVVGLIISILQTITSIQEQTLTYVPKIVAVFFILILCGSWILHTYRDYMIDLFSNFNYYIQNL